MFATASISTGEMTGVEVPLTIPRIGLAGRDGERLLVALEPIEVGEWLLTIEGEPVAVPCRYSVQVGPSDHIAPPTHLLREDGRDAFIWRFLNHSCNPNTIIVRRVLVAFKRIARGEEITFDYNTNEYSMAEPFPCRCGHCDGAEIRGYRFLTPAERRTRQDRLADHLKMMS